MVLFGSCCIHICMQLLTGIAVRVSGRVKEPGVKLEFRLLRALSVVLCVAALSLGLRAQDVNSNAGTDSSSRDGAGSITDSVQNGATSLADAPTTTTQSAEQRQPQTKRILGIVPNFRAVSTDEKLPPQSIKDKFMDATQDSFDYSSILLPGLLAAYSMGTDATPEFHQGAAGYARYFWHAAADQTIENYMVEFVVPTATREDTRYYTLGRGGFLKRTGYAVSRVVITRSDSGKEEFNFGEVVGAGGAAGISSLYYPTRERSLGKTGTQWGLDVGIDAAAFFFREFWPDVNHALFHAAKPPSK
jgi:hypothetical protein